MAPHANPQVLNTLAIYALLAVFLIWRYSRPMRLTVTRMFVMPGILLALTALAIWGDRYEHLHHAQPPAALALSLAVGAVVGIPFGILRGMHTTVKATDRPGVMYLGPSWVVPTILVGAYALRIGLRIAFSQTPFATLVGNGVLALAVATLITSYYVIYKKYRALEHQAGQI